MNKKNRKIVDALKKSLLTFKQFRDYQNNPIDADAMTAVAGGFEQGLEAMGMSSDDAMEIVSLAAKEFVNENIKTTENSLQQSSAKVSSGRKVRSLQKKSGGGKA